MPSSLKNQSVDIVSSFILYLLFLVLFIPPSVGW